MGLVGAAMFVVAGKQNQKQAVRIARTHSASTKSSEDITVSESGRRAQSAMLI